MKEISINIQNDLVPVFGKLYYLKRRFIYLNKGAIIMPFSNIIYHSPAEPSRAERLVHCLTYHEESVQQIAMVFYEQDSWQDWLETVQ